MMKIHNGYDAHLTLERFRTHLIQKVFDRLTAKLRSEVFNESQSAVDHFKCERVWAWLDYIRYRRLTDISNFIIEPTILPTTFLKIRSQQFEYETKLNYLFFPFIFQVSVSQDLFKWKRNNNRHIELWTHDSSKVTHSQLKSAFRDGFFSWSKVL